LNICVIPDAQVRPGIDLSYLTHIGKYIAHKRPDVVINLGDFYDMPSLCSYDVHKKSFEGRRYKDDIAAGNEGMRLLLKPMKDLNKELSRKKEKQYRPELIFTFGNHENRVNRAVDSDPKLDGTIGYEDFDLADWKTYPFLEIVRLGGVEFCHYFVTGTAGRPASTAAAQLRVRHRSCIAGHQQGLQIHMEKGFTSVICGSAYPDDLDYLGPQANRHWRGILQLHDVKDGEFDLAPIPLSYLKKRYG
jgi:hypothetical protein